MLALIENYGLLVFWFVAAARFVVPLSIPRYPLPGILASLILDAADQTIFQQFPGIDLAGYQGYDKALDIYYLSIAYISTMRNWKNMFAFQVSRFLFYWRLVGVALFELTHLRPLLLVFPNTFEYFFIFYEAYRLRWDPGKMSKKLVIAAAVLIWILIKLPQEYWIHIGQIDTTDWIKTSMFGVSVNTSWGEIVSMWPVIFLAVFVFIAAVVLGLYWLAKKKLPPPERSLSFSADAHQPAFTTAQVHEAVDFEANQIIDAAFFEKLVLVALVSLSFSQVLVGVQATNLELVAGVAIVVIVNTILSHLLARRGFSGAFTLQQFVVLVITNSILMLIYSLLRNAIGDLVVFTNAVFFVLIFSLLITLFDRYRQVYLMRIGAGENLDVNPGVPVGDGS